MAHKYTPGWALVAMVVCGGLPLQSRAAARPMALVPALIPALGASPVADPVGDVFGAMGLFLNAVTGNVDRMTTPPTPVATPSGDHPHRLRELSAHHHKPLLKIASE